MSLFSTIDALALADLLKEGGCDLIDVRNDEEVARGMIAGARHIPLAQLPARFSELGRDRPVVFYCQSGARSMQASAFLAARGWPQVSNLTGGVIAWVRSGQALVFPGAG